jgi:hypothetical protein
VLAAVAAAASFLIGLNIAGRAALPDRAGISSGAKLKSDKDQKDRSQAKREDREENKREKGEKGEKAAKDREQKGARSEAPESKKADETQPTGPQPLSRTECEQAGRTWNESTNTCG